VVPKINTHQNEMHIKNMLPFNTYQTDRSKKNFTHQAFSKGGEIIHKFTWIKKLRNNMFTF